jgi:integrase
MRVLTEAEAQRLLEACDETEKPFLHLALATGMRFNELAALEWRDVDFLKKNIYVRRSKTAAGIRDISINNSDIKVLTEMRRQTTEKHGISELIFRSREGNGVDYGNFTKRRFLPLVKRIGLAEVRFHDLRRTHATMLVLAGFDPMTITQRMGHSHISTTLQYYTAANEIRRREAADVSTKYTSPRRSPRNSTPLARLSPVLGLRGVDGSLRRQKVPTR